MLYRESVIRFCKKYRWLTAFCILAVYVCLIRMIPVVYASTLDELKARMDNLLGGFSRTNFEYMRLAYSTFKDFTMNDGGGVTKMRTITALIGDVMVIVFSLINIAKETQRGEISMDYWFRIAATLVVAIVLVTSVGNVMDYIYGMGDYVITAADTRMQDDEIETAGKDKNGNPLTVTVGKAGKDINSDENSDEKNNILEAMTYIPGLSGDQDGNGNIKELYNATSASDVSFFRIESAESIVTLMEYIVYAPMLICMFLVFSAIFEVKLRQIFAPIAVAAIAYEGGRSTGVRFLKKYMACFVKIALYFTIAAIGAEMTIFFYYKVATVKDFAGTDGVMAPENVINLIMMIGSNIVAAMSMMQIGGLGDEIVGV